jgi:hypothetical protein
LIFPLALAGRSFDRSFNEEWQGERMVKIEGGLCYHLQGENATYLSSVGALSSRV